MSTRLLDLIQPALGDQRGASSLRLLVGIVTDTKDPLGRVKLRIPSENNRVTDWARVAAPMAGNDRGCHFPMQTEDEVLVAFSGPDVYVLGALWNGKDKPPADTSAGNNDVCVIKSRKGHTVLIDDCTVKIVDCSGGNGIVIDMANNCVTIASAGDLKLLAPNGAVTIEGRTFIATATGGEAKLTGTTAEVFGDKGVNVHGDIVKIN